MENKILIGPAGSGGGDVGNFEAIKKLGLDAVELEFVHSIWLSKEQALKIRESNKNLNLKLSIHAPYYINLNSEDKSKITASRERILKTMEFANLLSNGEKMPVIFHAGFYMKKTKEETYNIIKEEILRIIEESDKRGLKNALACPETTGKPSQFGDIDELLKLMKETQCGICIDFAHILARNNGKINYDEIMNKIKNLDPEKITAHFSGINFGEKGEKNHILTEDKEIKELFHYLNRHNISITIINESPDPLGDAIKMKKIWEKEK